MRKHVAIAVTLACVGLGGFALADSKKATDAEASTSKAIDMAPAADKVAAYKDDVGNYYVLPIAKAFSDFHEAQHWLFVGDGKVMYQQRVIYSSERKDNYEITVWSPRAKDLPGGTFLVSPDTTYVACRPSPNSRRTLSPLGADATRTLLTKAKFMPPFWTRTARFLARDDDANYYYVDGLLPEFGGNGYRVFVGSQGGLKQLPLTNIASDSVGEIYATKDGKLKITAAREAVAKGPGMKEAIASKEATAFWIKGTQKTELTVVPVADNRYLIHRDLGIYGTLGTACDDQ